MLLNQVFSLHNFLTLRNAFRVEQTICKLLKTTVLVQCDIINQQIACFGVLIGTQNLIAETSLTGNKQDHTAFSCTSLVPKLTISKTHPPSLSLHKPLSWLKNSYCKHVTNLIFPSTQPYLTSQAKV